MGNVTESSHYWQTTRITEGKTVQRKYPQAAGKAEGDTGAAGLSLRVDNSDGSWQLECLRGEFARGGRDWCEWINGAGVWQRSETPGSLEIPDVLDAVAMREQLPAIGYAVERWNELIAQDIISAGWLVKLGRGTVRLEYRTRWSGARNGVAWTRRDSELCREFRDAVSLDEVKELIEHETEEIYSFAENFHVERGDYIAGWRYASTGYTIA